jgi:hypothetical protein
MSAPGANGAIDVNQVSRLGPPYVYAVVIATPIMIISKHTPQSAVDAR